jgi:serine/threonine protein kinase
VIAVKKLHNIPGLVEYQFKNELLDLMTVQHQNIIRLVGYCSEAQQKVAEHDGKKVLFYEEQRALCLEYMEGGTLEKLISGIYMKPSILN